MKAIGFKKSLPISEADSLIELDLVQPIPTANDILVKIEAISVNPVDYKVRQNTNLLQPHDQPKILGWDAAGTVVAVGDKVDYFKLGDRVFYAGDITRQGSYAEFQLVDENLVGHLPESIPFLEAAAMPLTSLTAWEALFEKMKLDQEDTCSKSILIIGGAGGVGSVAIQLVKQMTGLHLITTASRLESKKWCKNMGADLVVDHRNLVGEMQQAGHEHVDFILNCVNTDDYWEIMSKLIKPEGHICCIAESKWALDLNMIRMKSVTLSWEYVFTKAIYITEGQNVQRNILNQLAGLMESKKIKSTLNCVYKKFCVETLKEVHRKMESGSSIGKTVIDFINIKSCT
ncbi:zinc-binding alcohol dehydrogenase family protein [Marinifilum fragile]|uniref:zinc-binding alcohol dehydrogenase family protein n=1 Tax=Marinifilum fragile TaxID=570161 RepID=UPI002AA72EB0|nr:zinc-binding alcohol dehydrogenase family protein [Marinifilum fragile]